MRFSWVLAILLLGGATSAVLTRKEAPPQNVLIVTLDTLRADAAGRGRGTPAIESFLADAVHFTSARTVAPLTLPAHLSLFTGLAPSHHGIHDNCAPPVPAAEGRAYPLLAEEFRDAGYSTAAFVSTAVLHPRTGISSGFDLYDSPDYAASAEHCHASVPAPARIEAPLRWLQARPQGSPFFLWVHLFDAHFPYELFAGDERRAATRPGDSPATLYAGEVRRMDAAIERLLQSVPPNTIVILASDHGESLGEHGETTHAALCYGATIDAFLAVRAPALPRGAVDGGLRSLCDVAPSLRRWCGLRARSSDGLPLEGVPHPVLVSESLFAWGVHGWGQCFAATDGRHSLVESGPRVEMYDRHVDPEEVCILPQPESLRAFEHLDRALEALRGGTGSSAEPLGPVLGAVSPYGWVRIPFRRYLSRRENTLLPDPANYISNDASVCETIGALQSAIRADDAAATDRELARLRELAEQLGPDPLPRLFLLEWQEVVAGIRGDKRLYARAATAGLEAMRRGYVDPFVLRLTVRAALAAGDRDTPRTALALARAGGTHPDEECLAALRAAGLDASLGH